MPPSVGTSPDFGYGKFEEIWSHSLHRSQRHRRLKPYQAQTYCEKILIVREKSTHPEALPRVQDGKDIIGGGRQYGLPITIGRRTASSTLPDVEGPRDGVQQRVKAGEKSSSNPSDSVTLPHFMQHEFGRARHRHLRCGEVSKTKRRTTQSNLFLTAPRSLSKNRMKTCRPCTCFGH